MEAPASSESMSVDFGGESDGAGGQEAPEGGPEPEPRQEETKFHEHQFWKPERVKAALENSNDFEQYR